MSARPFSDRRYKPVDAHSRHLLRIRGDTERRAQQFVILARDGDLPKNFVSLQQTRIDETPQGPPSVLLAVAQRVQSFP